MKVVITLEDTPRGVDLNITINSNGVQDHPPDSLSVMNAVFMHKAMAHTVKCAHFNTRWKEDDTECAPTRQNLLT